MSLGVRDIRVAVGSGVGVGDCDDVAAIWTRSAIAVEGIAVDVDDGDGASVEVGVPLVEGASLVAETVVWDGVMATSGLALQAADIAAGTAAKPISPAIVKNVHAAPILVLELVKKCGSSTEVLGNSSPKC